LQKHLVHADAHAMGERIEGFGPVEGDEAKRVPWLEQDMGLGLLHGGRLTGDFRVARRGLAWAVANWQDIAMSAYPATRLRRLRRHDWTRREERQPGKVAFHFSVRMRDQKIKRGGDA
jgi:hypothetical protein